MTSHFVIVGAHKSGVGGRRGGQKAFDKTREKGKEAKKRKPRLRTEVEEGPSLRKENRHQMRLVFLTVALVLVQGVKKTNFWIILTLVG